MQEVEAIKEEVEGEDADSGSMQELFDDSPMMKSSFSTRQVSYNHLKSYDATMLMQMSKIDVVEQEPAEAIANQTPDEQSLNLTKLDK